ncbi:MAG: CPBP family intramembrane metalloprotease [Bacteroidia bacterium]|jgi:hypothetical protein|nr:CPBP family intramembrane metalloprotease [Bacteroidia bacterium]
MWRLIITLLAGAGVTALLYFLMYLSGRAELHLHQNPEINRILIYQTTGLLLALAVVWCTLKLNPASVKYLRAGNINVKAEKLSLVGIGGEKSWKNEFLSLLGVISAATIAFMYFTKGQNAGGFHAEMLVWIVLFSLSNSLSEELIYRFGVIGALGNLFTPSTVWLVSAFLFGAAHWGGNPGGPLGMCMAGILGYVSSKATTETNGLGIAWALHFVQDVIIYTFLLGFKN